MRSNLLAGTLARRLKAHRRRGHDHPLVLVYHRVSQAVADPQLLSVTPERFAEHLDFLFRRFRPVRLRDLVAATRDGQPAAGAVAITFDDGYADNLMTAKPLLERADVPATVFVASGYVGSGRPFWWDELEALLLRPGRLPSLLALPIEGDELRWELGADAVYSARRAAECALWTVLDSADPGPRQRIYRELCARLRQVEANERNQVLDRLRSLVELDDGLDEEAPRPLTLDEVRRLVDGGLVEVGAHTVTHPVLARLPVERQRHEVANSKRQLEDAVGRPVPSFAYPYGAREDLNDTTVSVVRAAGFDHACANIPGRITRETDWFRLPRVLVRDWRGAELGRRLLEVAS
jgi:peptidoglycan/xylan/chitin deacetylase (PgdA/CDA1 family)